MKKIILCSGVIAALLGSVTVFAQTTICPSPANKNNTAAAGPGAVPPSGKAGENYMMRAIAPKCSANTNVAGVDGTGGAWYSIGANSVKGKNNFAGHTNGGAVAATEPCGTAGGCKASEAEDARKIANDAAALSGGTGTGTGTAAGTGSGS